MRRCLLLAILILLVAPLAAQSTEAELKARLIHKPLYLRGQWHDDQLKFDANGSLIGVSGPYPFTLSGVEINSVKLSDKGLKLKGHRVGLVFDHDAIQRKSLESVALEIDPPAGGDYSSALQRIFTDDLAEFVPSLPSYWREYGIKHFLHGADAASGKDVGKVLSGEPKVVRVGGSVVPPKVLFAADPQFTALARSERIGGKVLVYVQVDREGKPNHVRILKPVGFGLDEMAAKSVSEYKFKPAEENGVPVAVELNVEVKFEIY